MSPFTNMPALFGRATAVLGQHAELHVTVNRLRRCSAEHRDLSTGEPELHELLDEFVPQLEAHFTAEEDEGYFGTLMTASPTSAAVVEKLRAEHVAFLNVARLLRVHAREPSGLPGFATTLSALLDDLSRHERAESLLLQQYFSEGQL